MSRIDKNYIHFAYKIYIKLFCAGIHAEGGQNVYRKRKKNSGSACRAVRIVRLRGVLAYARFRRLLRRRARFNG